MNKTAHPQFLLTKPTFVCLTNDTLVFLDLHNDKYMCLESKHTEPLSALLGLPVPSTNELDSSGASFDSNSGCNGEVANVVRDLTDRGLITRDSDNGKRAELIPQESDLKELLGYEIGKGPKIHVSHALNFFRALIITKFMLRWASMERIIVRIRGRKRNSSSELNDEKINELVEIYKILKPLFVTVKDNCLFNSFFLIEFLACHRIYPAWYFGVKLNEFSAHCWVQGGNYIYDDTIVHTYTHRPIMTA